eukprot:SAG31_NODE_2820_length_5041_cov_2.048968_3_plen_78_part_00
MPLEPASRMLGVIITLASAAVCAADAAGQDRRSYAPKPHIAIILAGGFPPDRGFSGIAPHRVICWHHCVLNKVAYGR